MHRLVLSPTLLVACASASTPATPPPAIAAPAAIRPEHDVGDWRSPAAMTRVNPRRFRSRGHGQLWVDIYVGAAQADAYVAQQTPAPPGMRVVMAGYDAEKDDASVGLTVMIKLADGWYYAALDGDATTASAQGPLRLCDSCHRNAPGGDGLFGLSRAASGN